MRAVRLAREQGANAAAERVGCSRRALYYWLAAFDAGGLAGLVDESQRPHRLRPGIPRWVDQVIITVRLLTYWNAKRIAAEMDRRQIYQVGHRYIERLLQVQGCAHLQSWLEAVMTAA